MSEIANTRKCLGLDIGSSTIKGAVLDLARRQVLSVVRDLNTITHLPAGRSLNVLVQLLTELGKVEGMSPADVWSYIARAAAEADGCGLHCNLAFFAGPMGDSGSIDGITVDNLTVGNLFRAALEHMADNYRLCAERLCPSRAWQRVVLSGGLAQSLPILHALIRQRFQAPLRESAESEETLAGLLSVAESVIGRRPR